MELLTNTWVGYACVIAFILAYSLVIFEEKIHLRKSKPVVLIGCLMWMLIGIYEAIHGGEHLAGKQVKHLIQEIGELFFFLLVAMTYINALEEKQVFASLKNWLLGKGLGFRSLFWVTGVITFFMSPIADNLTSALLMATVAERVSGGDRRFIILAFINIIVAANAGGAWSPFGDITTLMVWTAGKVPTQEFSSLILPSIVNWLIPALIMFPFIPKGIPEGSTEKVAMERGAKPIIFLGIATIATAVSFHQFLHLPPFLGMMLGMGYLMFLGYFLGIMDRANGLPMEHRFDVLRNVKNVEFDTLLFFFGVITAVGALQYLGYLTLANNAMYGELGFTTGNILVGILSAILDNIPVMFAVLQMDPNMGLDQWLLITLTTGTGGSLLSIGSAAGVAVMGVRKDIYTFMAHLKWAPVIALGYAGSILCWWLLT